MVCAVRTHAVLVTTEWFKPCRNPVSSKSLLGLCTNKTHYRGPSEGWFSDGFSLSKAVRRIQNQKFRLLLVMVGRNTHYLETLCRNFSQNPLNSHQRHFRGFLWLPSFQQTVYAMIVRHIDRFHYWEVGPGDWLAILIEQIPEPSKTCYFRDHRGRPAYPLLSMFNAVTSRTMGTASPIPNSNTASLPASISTCFGRSTNWASRL